MIRVLDKMVADDKTPPNFVLQKVFYNILMVNSKQIMILVK